MKKIGLIIPTLCFGGAERVITQLSIILEDLGYDVYLIVFNSQEIAFEYGGKLVDLDIEAKEGFFNKIINVIKRSIKLSRIKNKYKLDICISFLRAADLVNLISSGNKCKKVYSIRGFEDYIKNKRIYDFIIKNNKSTIIVQTHRLKEFIENENKIEPNNNILVLGNPFNIKIIRQQSEMSLDENIKQLIDGDQIICSVGSFKHAKNHWNLLKSFYILKEKMGMKEAKLVLVGGSGDLEDNIKDMAKKCKYSNDIIFLGTSKNPFSIIKNCSVFILPSLSEGIPNTLVEAMACGIPVIATDCKTGPREILYKIPDIKKSTSGIEYADYGILVQEFEKDIDYNFEEISESNFVLAEAIEKVLNNENIKQLYKIKAVEGADRLDIDRYKELVLKIIDKIDK